MTETDIQIKNAIKQLPEDLQVAIKDRLNWALAQKERLFRGEEEIEALGIKLREAEKLLEKAGDLVAKADQLRAREDLVLAREAKIELVERELELERERRAEMFRLVETIFSNNRYKYSVKGHLPVGLQDTNGYGYVTGGNFEKHVEGEG